MVVKVPYCGWLRELRKRPRLLRVVGVLSSHVSKAFDVLDRPLLITEKKKNSKERKRRSAGAHQIVKMKLYSFICERSCELAGIAARTRASVFFVFQKE